jgi:DNA adenine methylase
MDSNLPKPVLKWVGGKRQVLPELLKHIPAKFVAYHEPFVGGGALFFELYRLDRLKAPYTYIADVNPELINLYTVIQDEFAQFLFALGELATHHVNEVDFYKLRKEYAEYDNVGRAALFIYFNRTGFNGIMRQNRSGNWNMPWGRHTNPTVLNKPVLHAAREALLRTAVVTCEDFTSAMNRASPGDLVYCDPPYIPVSKTADFVDYSKDGFNLSDHKRLAEKAKELVSNGVHVILSNSDTPQARELYKDFTLYEVQASRSINCKVEKRGPVGELIVVG